MLTSLAKPLKDLIRKTLEASLFLRNTHCRRSSIIIIIIIIKKSPCEQWFCQQLLTTASEFQRSVNRQEMHSKVTETLHKLYKGHLAAVYFMLFLQTMLFTGRSSNVRLCVVMVLFVTDFETHSGEIDFFLSTMVCTKGEHGFTQIN